MSCNSGNLKSEDCVTDIVKGIVKAQHKAVETEQDTCLTSCDQSIAELLSPAEENRGRIKHNTIPFMLFCKASCKPFIGSGVRKLYDEGSNRQYFDCIESPIFKAKSFVDNKESCVRLELLLPVQNGVPQESNPQNESVCNFFPNGGASNFESTGICITVDLNCFCGISCLDPITPLSTTQPQSNPV